MARLFGTGPSVDAKQHQHQQQRSNGSTTTRYRIISLMPIDMCTWHRLSYRWLPVVSHRTARTLLHPREDDRCRVGWRASTHRLEMPIYILQQSRAAGPGGFVPPTPVLGPGQSLRKDRIRRIATPLISQAVSSKPQDLSSHMDVCRM